MDLTEQLRIGQEAEDFKRYIEEHPYFNGLIDRMKLEYVKVLLDLQPDQKDDFCITKSEMRTLDQIPNAISGDIYLGQRAYEQINGISEEPKGLL